MLSSEGLEGRRQGRKNKVHKTHFEVSTPVTVRPVSRDCKQAWLDCIAIEGNFSTTLVPHAGLGLFYSKPYFPKQKSHTYLQTSVEKNASTPASSRLHFQTVDVDIFHFAVEFLFPKFGSGNLFQV